ncbi:HAD family hydrolase [Lancefieldella parvula]|uniref:HAD family hydrolase n=1 Tax=Lancefieldella parvula TaxID=1382 RepID=UPI00288B33F1|nr:HAD-IA family hydrolase [Lancefieldella parvula]
MAYKAAVFDLDGTLLNTIDDLAWATNYALKQFNMPTYTVDEVRQMVGNGVAKLIRDAVPEDTDDATYQQVLACFKEHYADHSLDNTVPYPGILDAIDILKAAGVKCAVVSNKPNFAITDLMKNFFPGRFDFALGQRDDLKRKPNAEPVHYALAQIGVNPKDAVYIGDSEVDVKTAQNSNMPCISVTWGFRDKDTLLAAGATTLVDTADEMVQKILNN